MHGIPTDVIYLDYAKAFDTVPHQRLLEQVESFGIKDKENKWMEALLCDRTQTESVNGKHSGWCSVISGVPQGFTPHRPGAQSFYLCKRRQKV